MQQRLLDDALHVSTVWTIEGMWVESFDAWKQELLMEAEGDLIGLDPADLEVTLVLFTVGEFAEEEEVSLDDGIC